MAWSFYNAAGFLKSNSGRELVSALPSSAVDGQEVFYQASGTMATDGIVWHLRYDASSASVYKWEFVGGSDLFAVDSGETQTNSTSWAGTGPSLTIPLGGDYIISYISGYYNSSAVDYGWTSISVGGSTASSNADAVIVQAFATSKWVSMSRSIKKTSLSSSIAIQMRHQVSSGTGNFGYRSLEITPVRVG